MRRERVSARPRIWLCPAEIGFAAAPLIDSIQKIGFDL
jgi:hypothetical protein